jgi:hypothetical protein
MHQPIDFIIIYLWHLFCFHITKHVTENPYRGNENKMSTVKLISGGVTEATYHTEELSDEQMFNAVQNSVARFAQFEEWLAEVRRREYERGWNKCFPIGLCYRFTKINE